MAAGDSAGDEARRQLALADAHEAAAEKARSDAGNWAIASATEKRTAILLAPLSVIGYVPLHDRSWPGSRHAQVDLVLVGPGGVFIVDTKAWKEVTIDGGRVFRGQEDVTEDIENLSELGRTVEEDLAEVGLAPGEVHVVMALVGERGRDASVGTVRMLSERDLLRHIASRGMRLGPALLDLVLARTLALFPPVGAPAPVNVAVPEPVLPAPEPLAEADLPTEDEVREAIFEGIMAAPIEEWMAFLDPDQAKLILRSFNGPSRIRGSVGTGKTVVGLHRAAYFARTKPGRLLVTAYVRTLPPVMAQLMTRLAPDVADRIDFIPVHAFALRLLKDRGVTVSVDRTKLNSSFNAAWRDVGEPGPLGKAQLDKTYWKDEIDYVIKGRGITRVEAYLDLARTGRQYRLGVDQRRAVWGMYDAYNRELRARQSHDWADVITMAEAELRREPLAEPYSAVIVDEAQDLSCAMVRLLYGLVGDAQDGFTLIGDGQQSIYPGGYTLAEAGVSVAGRGVVLDVNYRNTAQILLYASSLVAGSQYADIEGEMARGEAPRSVDRIGPEPMIERSTNRAEHDARLVARARDVVRDVGTGWGDVGVLCETKAEVGKAERALTAARIPTVSLEKYDGRPVDAVKVGTIKRAKGLEFKQVLVPGVHADLLADATRPADDAARERWELTRRELYVGMTRARDGLWVGLV